MRWKAASSFDEGAWVSSASDPSTTEFSISAATCRKMGPASSFKTVPGLHQGLRQRRRRGPCGHYSCNKPYKQPRPARKPASPRPATVLSHPAASVRFPPSSGGPSAVHLSPHQQERLLLSYAAELTVGLGPAAGLSATEQVLLGRSGEKPGRWTGTTRVVPDGTPLLHTTVDLGAGAPSWLPPVAPRAYASTVDVRAGKAEVATGQDAVRLPLPGGWVSTAWGAELHQVVAALDALSRPDDARGSA